MKQCSCFYLMAWLIECKVVNELQASMLWWYMRVLNRKISITTSYDSHDKEGSGLNLDMGSGRGLQFPPDINLIEHLWDGRAQKKKTELKRSAVNAQSEVQSNVVPVWIGPVPACPQMLDWIGIWRMWRPYFKLTYHTTLSSGSAVGWCFVTIWLILFNPPCHSFNKVSLF